MAEQRDRADQRPRARIDQVVVVLDSRVRPWSSPSICAGFSPRESARSLTRVQSPRMRPQPRGSLTARRSRRVRKRDPLTSRPRSSAMSGETKKTTGRSRSSPAASIALLEAEALELLEVDADLVRRHVVGGDRGPGCSAGLRDPVEGQDGFADLHVHVRLAGLNWSGTSAPTLASKRTRMCDRELARRLGGVLRRAAKAGDAAEGRRAARRRTPGRSCRPQRRR